MSDGNEQMRVEFHNRATTTFFSVYHAFEKTVSNVSRRREEFRFQQAKKQYVIIMERELEVVAKDILTRNNSGKQVKDIDQAFHQYIKDYLHRFIQKVNDL